MKMTWRGGAALAALGLVLSGFGVGTARAGFVCPFPGAQTSVGVAVWCFPNNPYDNPNFPNYIAQSAGVTATAFLGPNLPGCNPQTAVSISGGSVPTCAFVWAGGAYGGDSFSLDGTDLLPLVTPTAFFAEVGGEVTTTPLDANRLEVRVSWFGSDEGTAHRLLWFDMTDPARPVELVQHRLVRAGPHSETITMTVFAPSGLATLGLQFDAIAVSAGVPEPSALALLGLGGFTLLGYAARRRRAA